TPLPVRRERLGEGSAKLTCARRVASTATTLTLTLSPEYRERGPEQRATAHYFTSSSSSSRAARRGAISGARSSTLSAHPYSTASSAKSHLLRSKSRWIRSIGLPVASASIL